ncbi:FkbM family methyltransferase [Cyanobium sp. CH-040]|uniref:FkbM family methyltransferase n=1 Tax=Cyanobium sp. CH-040 TaxID=2823708 RepID=UPI0020CDE226|nr:FkbM family methyltransferase [Cyanobium sp. CH-040]MCP9927990.1 FkbM family methyltransferase [Cyanobium sp. CH-040]
MDSSSQSASHSDHKNQLPIVVYDIGARGGLGAEWNECPEPIHAVLFEPDLDEYNKLVARSNSLFQQTVLPIALSDQSGESHFFVTTNRQCSSLLEPNIQLLEARYGAFARHFHVEEVIKTNVRRLDEVILEQNLPTPDAIKLDIQGAESLVLSGLGTMLTDVKAVRLEVHFRELYLGEDLFDRIHAYMDSHGFELRRILNDKGRRFRGGEIVEVDVFYVNHKYLLPSAQACARHITNTILHVWNM